MDAYTLELKKLLADHQAPQVMKSLIETLEEVRKSSPALREEIEPLQSEIIMLSSRLSKVNKEQEQNLINISDARIELARIDKSLLGTLNNLDENYPGLEKYFQEREEDSAWATASAANDIETYQAFFTKYPHGKYREETQRLIQKLKALEVKKNLAFKKTAEAERKRRQQVPVNKKPQDGTLKYILIAVGIFVGIVGLYFLVDNLSSPKAEKSRARIVPTEDLSKDQIKENEAKEREAKPVELKESLTANIKHIPGTWKSDKGWVRLKVSGNRVYGDLEDSGIIEGLFAPTSQTVKGELIEGAKKTTFLWRVEGWTLKGRETWIFTDKQINLRWSGQKSDSREPELQNFPWDGLWDTNKGYVKFIQKGNIVTGALRGDGFSSGKIEAFYNSSTKSLKGKIATQMSPGTFEIFIRGKDAFAGSGSFIIAKPFPKLTKTSWSGKKRK